MSTITLLLREFQAGAPGASDKLFSHIYPELKKIALGHLRSRSNGMLQATALVNEAFVRLAGAESLEPKGRGHLFYLLSRAMHDVLVEHVRADQALKRGGGAKPQPLLEIVAEDRVQNIDILDLNAALEELERVDGAAAKAIMLRFYGGLSIQETADSMGCTFAATRKNWDYAKAWLLTRLAGH